MEIGTAEIELKEILEKHPEIEDFFIKNKGAIIFNDGDVRVIEGLTYGKLEAVWHAGEIKQVNITQNIRLNEER